MTALVTGSSGLLGSAVVRRLLKDGVKVRATYHKKPPVIQDSRIEYVKADLTKPEDCQKVTEGIEQAYLCAACTGGAALTLGSSAPVTQTLIINTNMLEAARTNKVERVGLVSSTTVYAEGTHKFKEAEGNIGEPYKGYFGIGWMNRYQEKLAEYFHRSFDMKIAIVRPTNIYGPNDDFNLKTAHVLPALIAKVVTGMNPLEVWGDGSQVRDFIYADDAAEGFVTALLASPNCEPFNIGSGEAVSVKELIDIIIEQSGLGKIEVKYDSTKPVAIPVRVVDTSLASEKLGFSAKTGVREGVGQTINWFRQNMGKAA